MFAFQQTLVVVEAMAPPVEKMKRPSIARVPTYSHVRTCASARAHAYRLSRALIPPAAPLKCTLRAYVHRVWCPRAYPRAHLHLSLCRIYPPFSPTTTYTMPDVHAHYPHLLTRLRNSPLVNAYTELGTDAHYPSLTRTRSTRTRILLRVHTNPSWCPAYRAWRICKSIIARKQAVTGVHQNRSSRIRSSSIAYTLNSSRNQCTVVGHGNARASGQRLECIGCMVLRWCTYAFSRIDIPCLHPSRARIPCLMSTHTALARI